MAEVQEIQVEIDYDQAVAWSHIPGLSYGDFGRKGTINLWKIAKIFEAGRLLPFSKGFLEWPKIVTKTHGAFVFGIRYEFNSALWTIHRLKSFPYKISLELCDLGKTSFTTHSRFVNKLDDKQLASCTCKLVYIERTSSRPVPYPQHVWQKYAPAIKQRKPMEFPRHIPEVAASAFLYPTVVGASDTDWNGHTNHCSYIRFCCDAAQSSLIAQKLRGFQEDISLYPIKVLEVIYLGESWAGDKLKVWVWQEDVHILHFIIVCENGSQNSNIFQAVIVYELNNNQLQTSKL